MSKNKKIDEVDMIIITVGTVLSALFVMIVLSI